MASLKYAEVGDAAEAATCLQAVGMAELLGADDWPDILQVSSSDLNPDPSPGVIPPDEGGAYVSVLGLGSALWASTLEPYEICVGC